mmetsp:Transcript_16788/g.27247  ORF Transcript_16788/g.27247 Transcript_16788/m.27247 type:complete len:225 (+) Transcript_16788:143-817(+)
MCDGKESKIIHYRRFCCPLTKMIMKDPVLIVSTGKSYERHALLSWMEQNGERCPVTGKDFELADITTNFSLQWEILFWQRQCVDETFPTSDDVCKVEIIGAASSSRRRASDPSVTNCTDTAPTRPLRRGSYSGGSVPCEVEAINHEEPELCPSRFVPSCSTNTAACGMNLVPPRRTISGLSSPEFYQSLPYDESSSSTEQSDSEEMDIDRLVSILDEALLIVEK